MSPSPDVRGALAVAGLHKAFDGTPVLRGVDLEVAPGESVAIFGPSGGGKSTLLRCINLLETPEAGTIELSGSDVPYRALSDARRARHRARVGMVFQHFHLFEHMNVLQNLVEAPTGVLGQRKVESAATARALLDRVGLAGREDAWPRELSGGQKQRVAIARALAMRPEVILLDEVTSALDVEVVKEIHELLIDIAKEGMTSLAVTHDLGFARAFATRLVFMDAGKIVESEPPEQLLERPASERLQQFLAAVT